MVGLLCGFLAKHLLVVLLQEVQNVAVGVWIPAVVAAAEHNLHACHREAALESGGFIFLHGLV